MQRPTILLVEDDPAMRSGLRDNLEYEGYQVVEAADIAAARAALAAGPDLVLLDLMLPDGDGIDLCRQIRSRGAALPIILLTARGEEHDRLLGFGMGADDYVVKPFSLRELLARIRVHLRRSLGSEPDGKVQVGVAQVDFDRHRITRDGEELQPSAKELELLRYLVERRGLSVSRDEILAQIWGHQGTVETRTIDNFIVRLRKKIEPDPAQPRYLLTVHGVGYKLVEQ